MASKRGIAYPLSIENGSLKLSEDADLLLDKIYSVLEIRPTEFVMQPTLGTPDYCFSAANNDALIPGRLEAALIDQVPDPDDFFVTGSIEESGLMSIDIRYTLAKIEQPPIQFRLKV